MLYLKTALHRCTVSIQNGININIARHMSILTYEFFTKETVIWVREFNTCTYKSSPFFNPQSWGPTYTLETKDFIFSKVEDKSWIKQSLSGTTIFDFFENRSLLILFYCML